MADYMQSPAFSRSSLRSHLGYVSRPMDQRSPKNKDEPTCRKCGH
jgi:hypothetical protein